MTVNEILEQAKALPIEERQSLVKLLIDTLVNTDNSDKSYTLSDLVG